jgi:hypothetical protein
MPARTPACAHECLACAHVGAPRQVREFLHPLTGMGAAVPGTMTSGRFLLGFAMVLVLVAGCGDEATGTGLEGSQGEVGPAGPSGPSGPSGPTGQEGESGARGPAGATGVVSITNLVSPGITVNGSSLSFVWAATPVSVTIASGQRVTGSAVAILGTSSGTATSVSMGLCHQAAGGPIAAFEPNHYTTVASISQRALFSAAGTKADLAPGAYSIGFCVRNVSPTPLNANDVVNGWVMVTN